MAAQAPLTGVPGSRSWAVGAKERTGGQRFRGWRGGLSCRGPGVTFFRGGGRAARGSQAYLGPRALCRVRRHEARLGVRQPAGRCGRSVYTGRPPGPARQGRERLTADWRELAAVMPHRVSSAPARQARPATPGWPPWDGTAGSGGGERVVAELGQDGAGPAEDLAGLGDGGALAAVAVLDLSVITVVGSRRAGVGLAGLIHRPAQHLGPLPGQPPGRALAVRGPDGD